MPTTSYPCDFNSAAVVEESTTPDLPPTTLVSTGPPSRSRLLSMNVWSLLRSRHSRRNATIRKPFGERCPLRGFDRRTRSEPVFNIGAIGARQSHPARNKGPGGGKH